MRKIIKMLAGMMLVSFIPVSAVMAESCADLREGEVVKYDRPNPANRSGHFHFEVFGYLPNRFTMGTWLDRSGATGVASGRAAASAANHILNKILKGKDAKFAAGSETVTVTVTGVQPATMDQVALLKADQQNRDRFVRCLWPTVTGSDQVTFTGVPVGTVHSLRMLYRAFRLGADGVVEDEVSVVVEAENFELDMDDGAPVIGPTTLAQSANFRLVPDTVGTGSSQVCDGDGKVCVGMAIGLPVAQ